jgi:hypothetical protein
MKYILTIKKEEEIIFDGKPINLPIKKDVLKQKSFEMFGDYDPCIIHQTYVIESFCDRLVSKFKEQLNQEIRLSEHIEEIKFIDIENIDQMNLIVRRK